MNGMTYENNIKRKPRSDQFDKIYNIYYGNGILYSCIRYKVRLDMREYNIFRELFHNRLFATLTRILHIIICIFIAHA